MPRGQSEGERARRRERSMSRREKNISRARKRRQQREDRLDMEAGLSSPMVHRVPDSWIVKEKKR